MHDLLEQFKEIIIKYDLLIVAAGIVSTYITEWIKCAVAWKRKAAVVLSVVIAAILAVAAGWVGGTINTWADVLKDLVGVIAVAQIWYNAIVYNKPVSKVPVIE